MKIRHKKYLNGENNKKLLWREAFPPVRKLEFLRIQGGKRILEGWYSQDTCTIQKDTRSTRLLLGLYKQ